MAELTPAVVGIDEVRELAQQARLADTHGPLVVISETISDPQLTFDPLLLGAEPCVVVGSDVAASSPEERTLIIANVARMPIAAITTCQLIRATVAMSAHPNTTEARLLLESATYSTLQSGPEFGQWFAERRTRLAARAAARVPAAGDPAAGAQEHGPAVLLERADHELHIVLNRPHHGNAVNRQLRDEVCEGLALCGSDPSIDTVVLRGNGTHFCTGGDLDEFGTFANPADAHVVRTQRSPTRMLAGLHGHVHRHAILHGNCAGSGVELAAFADHVDAHPATTFWLPELSLGLVPGAGGTVSIVDRIGGPRTAWLLLTGTRITATTALQWGLVNAILTI